MSARSRGLLFLPLLTAFRRSLPQHRATGPSSQRLHALESAVADWLNPAFLDRVPDDVLIPKLIAFYRDVVTLPWHEEVFRRKPGLVRFGLNHILHAHDPLPARLKRCACPDGQYFRPGLGIAFWFAIAKATDPDRLPDWRPGVVRGLSKLGLLGTTSPRDVPGSYAVACKLYEQLLAEYPELTASDLDTFFCQVANLEGRELGSCDDPTEPNAGRIEDSLRLLRSERPLRKRITETNLRLASIRQTIEATPNSVNHHAVFQVVNELLFTTLQPTDANVGDWLPQVIAVSQVMKTAADLLKPPLEAEGITRVSEMALLSALLHVRLPNRFPLWCDTTRRGVQTLSDAINPTLPVWEQYRLACEVIDHLRDQFRVHSCEVVPLLAKLTDRFGEPDRESTADARMENRKFSGFCTDTFRFLADLQVNNASDWMAAHRERYSFAVREPLVELCEALTMRYVRPVLQGEYGWELETDARPGRALSSICKNDFGRATAYKSELWVTFYRRDSETKRNDVQFFVRLDSSGVAFGFHLGRTARDAGKRFRKTVQEHGEQLYAALVGTKATDQCGFGSTLGESATAFRSVTDLRAWSTGKELFASRHLRSDSPIVRDDELVGEILITFDRLLPLFAAAVCDDPRPLLARRAGHPDARPAFDRVAFQNTTYQSDVWLTRCLDLLQSKKQLILQGVPGTGKTHVARQLARFITGDRGNNVRLVQFHPGYSYEEFVEGIRPRTVEVNGHNELTYPVEPGVLATFVDQAMKCPAEPHVLVIDEINRGNLPRVFGELLFLLEYRDQEVTLPYSKQLFRIPSNLFILGTMNPVDQSVSSIDQALRRRFSFVEMCPDAALLANWFENNPPADDDATFAPQLVKWFDDLNHRLIRDAGPDRQIGHSFFMVPQMTREQLRTIWQHQVRPLLEGTFPGRPDRIDAFSPDRMIGTGKKQTRSTNPTV